MKIKEIDAQEFNSYASNHKYHSYYQSSCYGYLMSNYGLKPLYLGFFNNNNLVGASLILYKVPFMGFKYGYAPRGILVDYDNYSELIDIIKHLKNYLLKERFMLFKIDPLILSTKRDAHGAILETNERKSNIIECLKSTGFYHCGNSISFESIKPRWLSILSLEQEEDKLFKSFSKPVKNKIRKALKLGVEIFKDNDKLEEIYPFIKNKGDYSLEYYKDLINCFGKKVEIYVAKINTEKFVEGSQALYEEEQEYNGYLNNIISHDGYKGKDIKKILSRKMESDKLLTIYKEYLVKSITLLQKYPEGIIISGSIIIKHNDTIHLVIDGYNKEYGKLCPLYLARWEIIKNYLNSDYKFFDMNAITGLFDDTDQYKNLNKLKFGYNAIAHEYLGEFNLIINNPIYTLYKSVIKEDSFKNIKK